MKIPVLCIAPYIEWDNGVSGCVLVFNWDGGRPIFFLVNNDCRTADFTSDSMEQSFTPEEEQWFDTFFAENGSIAACHKFTTVEDYRKYHFILLDNGLLADLLADCICTYLTAEYKIWYRILKDDRLEQHLADLLQQNNLSDTIDAFRSALIAEDWRLSILKSAMSRFNYDLLINNYIHDTINQCISHIGERLFSSGIAVLALVGEQLSIHMEQHSDNACWYRFVEDYLNDRASIKLLHCSKYSIRQIIAFASLAKHYAVHPSLETSFALEPLTPQERIAIFKMYFQNISEEELKHLNEQDDPLCYKLPTHADAQISACNKMLDRCQFVPYWLPEEVRPTYENYEWAFRNYIRSEFNLDITNHLPSSLAVLDTTSTSVPPAKFPYIKSDAPDEIKAIEDTLAIYVRGNKPSELCKYLFENEGSLFMKMPKHADTIFSCIIDRLGDQNQITKDGLRTAWRRLRHA